MTRGIPHFFRSPVWGLALGLFLVGCAHPRYTYVPEENIEEASRSAKQIDYPIWSGPREGDIAVGFVGLIDVESKQGDPKTRTAHLTMQVTNDSKTDWRIDTQQVFLTIPGRGRNRAAYVDANAPGVPQIAVKPGQKERIDFYFPLPEDMRQASALPDFTLDWRLETPGKTIAQRTEFQRVAADPYIPSVYASPIYPYGYRWGFDGPAGPFWWYDPVWPAWSDPGVLRREKSR